MTNTEIIQAIRNEIERLKTVQLKRIQEGDLVDAEPYDKNEAYNELLSFLDTLEPEKPMNLEEEINRYLREECSDDDEPCIHEIAEHFAEWGYLRAAEKYNEIEYNRQMAEESKKPIEGLEEEIKSFTEELECGAKNIYCSMFGKEGNFDKFSWKDINAIIKDTARHFYELGCRRTAEKYDEIEFNRQRAEESVCKDLEKEIDFQTFSKEMGAVFALPKERTENTEEEPLRWEYEIARHFAKWGAKHLSDDSKTSPNDLEEAAKTFFDTLEGKEAWSYGPDHYDCEDVNNAFIAGAKWQKEQDEKEQADLFTIVALDAAQRAKEQMMKEAVDGIVEYDYSTGDTDYLRVLAEISSNQFDVKDGDKVRVIVCKKED